ncbi:MAG: family 16 glycoside hydrolase [Thalassotalea sp.]
MRRTLFIFCWVWLFQQPLQAKESPQLKQVNVAQEQARAMPTWIWKQGKKTTEFVEFQKIINLDELPSSAQLRTTGDMLMALSINNTKVSTSRDWRKPLIDDIAQYLVKGQNIINAKLLNEKNEPGFIFDLQLSNKTKGTWHIISDSSWQTKVYKGQWQAAAEIKPYGTKPWGDVLYNPASVQETAKTSDDASDNKPQDLALKTLPGFKAEKIYTVDKETQGSWVALTHDHKGRILSADQYGAIHRITLGSPLAVEKLSLKTSNAHGLLYAFDALYVITSFGDSNGLYRLSDTNGDDQFDKEEYLIPISSSGEHGAHSIVLSPDKKSLYIIAGNYAVLPNSVTKTRAAKNWGEDQLFPRMADPRGHAKNRLAPGGWVINISPDGKHQELIAHGFRNIFDAAFNNQGELFTFDSDMEYDVGTPWYRPTRVNHVVSGVDYGWRNGSGKWPEYYGDTLPATLNIGPGSPTGLVSGNNAKFPAKYQNAIFINDWTYGTMYAVHLTPDGASYKATKEEFVAGKPLPLTDLIIHPDGNMYFVVGGRRTQSALYKLSYIGNESTAAISALPITKELKIRRELEQLHVDGIGPESIATAWQYLSHSDRFIRYAARTVIEKQPVYLWRDKFTAEQNDWAIIEGATALARVGEPKHKTAILTQLKTLDYPSIRHDKFLAALRAYDLTFIRLEQKSNRVNDSIAFKDKQLAIDTLNPLFPTKDNLLNRELAKILLYLNAPGAVSKTVHQMLTATEEQAEFISDEILNRNERYKKATLRMKQSQPNIQQYSLAFLLRSISEGWTEADRTSYFSWFPRAKTWQGGNSFSHYIENARKEALIHVVDDSARQQYAHSSLQSEIKSREITPPQGPGQIWTVASASKAFKNNQSGRNFKNGENLYHAASCASCHLFNGQNGGIGPDLTGSSNRYTITDMMENIIEPSKVISDQYGSTLLNMKDGSQIIGRIGGEEDGVVTVMTNPFAPDSAINVDLSKVKNQEPWHISPMPPGLLNALNAEELSDLISYIFSAGDDQHEYFTSKNSSQKPSKSAQAIAKSANTVQLFNGKNFEGWQGDLSRWRVENGVIVGSTMEHSLKHNSFLIWDGLVGDFELSLEVKVEGQNNSGVMYRAAQKKSEGWRLTGNQLDIHPKPVYVGMLYSEGTGRNIVARGGTKVKVDAETGEPSVVGKTEPVIAVDISTWQTYKVVAKGNRLQHYVNGRLTIDLEDDHKDKLLRGKIGLQIHKGKPMKAYFRNIQLKKLN